MPWNKNYRRDIDILKFLNDLMRMLGAPGSHLYHFYCFIYERVHKSKMSLCSVAKRQSFSYKKFIEGKIPPYKRTWNDSFKIVKASSTISKKNLFRAFGLNKDGVLLTRKIKRRNTKIIIIIN